MTVVVTIPARSAPEIGIIDAKTPTTIGAGRGWKTGLRLIFANIAVFPKRGVRSFLQLVPSMLFGELSEKK